jgi:hypothetical protein
MGDYSGNSYQRPARALLALEDLVGPQTMDRIMRTYVDRWRFRHPGSNDFFAVANEVSGQDLSWFWDDFFRGLGHIDYSVDKASCVEVPSSYHKGLFDLDGGMALVEPDPKSRTRVSRCEVEVSRTGDVAMPVTLQLDFGDGGILEEPWDGLGRWKRWELDRAMPGGKLREARLMAKGGLALDATPANDSRTTSLHAEHAVSLFGWFTYVGQLLASLASWLA